MHNYYVSLFTHLWLKVSYIIYLVFNAAAIDSYISFQVMNEKSTTNF